MLDYLILIFCFLILLIYFFTKEFDSLIGLFLVFMVIFIIVIRANLFKNIPTNLFNPSTLFISSLFVLVFVIVASGILFIKKKNKKKKHVFLLFFLYLIFGLIQQLLFQYVFLETLNFLLNNFLISVFVSAIYYSLFHTKRGIEFFIFTLGTGLIWSTIYLKYGNIIPLIISHAILGTVYYTWIFKGEAIKNRSKLFRKIL